MNLHSPDECILPTAGGSASSLCGAPPSQPCGGSADQQGIGALGSSWRRRFGNASWPSSSCDEIDQQGKRLAQAQQARAVHLVALEGRRGGGDYYIGSLLDERNERTQAVDFGDTKSFREFQEEMRRSRHVTNGSVHHSIHSSAFQDLAARMGESSTAGDDETNERRSADNGGSEARRSKLSLYFSSRTADESAAGGGGGNRRRFVERGGTLTDACQRTAHKLMSGKLMNGLSGEVGSGADRSKAGGKQASSSLMASWMGEATTAEEERSRRIATIDAVRNVSRAPFA